MPNKRVSVELIKKEKKRRITYEKRKSSLLKKAMEFSILCNVPACVIIVPGKTKDPQPGKVETWPPQDTDVMQVIARYKATDQPRKLDVSDYFIDKKSKVDSELAKLNRHIWKRNYTAWNKGLDGSSDAELRVLLAQLSARLEAVERRCLMMKGGRVCMTDGVGTNGHAHQNMSCGSDYYPKMVGKDLSVGGMQAWINPSALELDTPLALPPTGYLQPVQPHWSGSNANFLQRGGNGLSRLTDSQVLSNSRFQGPFGFQPMQQAPMENWKNWNHQESHHWSDVGSSSNNPFASSEWQQPSVSFNPGGFRTRDYGMMLPNWTYPSLNSIAAMLPSFQSHTPQAHPAIEFYDVTEPQVEDQTRFRL